MNDDQSSTSTLSASYGLSEIEFTSLPEEAAGLMSGSIHVGEVGDVIEDEYAPDPADLTISEHIIARIFTDQELALLMRRLPREALRPYKVRDESTGKERTISYSYDVIFARHLLFEIFKGRASIITLTNTPVYQQESEATWNGRACRRMLVVNQATVRVAILSPCGRFKLKLDGTASCSGDFYSIHYPDYVSRAFNMASKGVESLALKSALRSLGPAFIHPDDGEQRIAAIKREQAKRAEVRLQLERNIDEDCARSGGVGDKSPSVADHKAAGSPVSVRAARSPGASDVRSGVASNSPSGNADPASGALNRTGSSTGSSTDSITDSSASSASEPSAATVVAVQDLTERQVGDASPAQQPITSARADDCDARDPSAGSSVDSSVDPSIDPSVDPYADAANVFETGRSAMPGQPLARYPSDGSLSGTTLPGSASSVDGTKTSGADAAGSKSGGSKSGGSKSGGSKSGGSSPRKRRKAKADGAPTTASDADIPAGAGAGAGTGAGAGAGIDDEIPDFADTVPHQSGSVTGSGVSPQAAPLDEAEAPPAKSATEISLSLGGVELLEFERDASGKLADESAAATTIMELIDKAAEPAQVSDVTEFYRETIDSMATLNSKTILRAAKKRLKTLLEA